MSLTQAIKQHTFAGGEISQELAGRTDLERYGQSVSTCENWLITPTGVAKNRPGFKYVAEVADSSARPRLIPFVFNQDQQYVIELGDQTMRFYQSGGLVQDKTWQRGYATSTDGTGVTLTDNAGHPNWTVNEFKGAAVYNLTTGSEDEATANTATTVTMSGITGGWTTGDQYKFTIHEGDHSGAGDASILTDSGKNWGTDSLIGGTIYNLSDRSEGVITDNDATTVTATLTGGQDNNWDNGDLYEIKLTIVVETPWRTADLPYVKFAQWNDLMILTCPGYTPHELRRYSDDNWTLTPFDVTRPVEPPTSLSCTTTFGAATATNPDEEWDWVVTTVDAQGNESLISNVYNDTGVTWLTAGTFIKGAELTWTAPALGNDPESYNIYRGLNGIYGYVGSSDTNSWRDLGNVPDYSDSPPTATNPFIDPVTTDRRGARRIVYDVGDDTDPFEYRATKDFPTEAYGKKYTYSCSFSLAAGNWIGLNFSYNVGGADQPLETVVFQNPSETEQWNGTITRTYEIDGMDTETYEFIADADSAGDPSFIGYGLTVTWTEDQGTATEVDTLPSSVCFFEQRVVFGGFSNNPSQIKASRTGDFYNFDKSSPLKDDDTLSLTLASMKNDEIKDLMPLEKLFVFTAGSEWVIQGADGGPLTPTSFDLKARTSYGASSVRPLAVGNAVLFCGDRSRKVREFSYDGLSQTGKTRDLTILTEHLFRHETIEEWAYADVPYQIVWAIRSDGTLLGLTYVQEQEMWAWHRHLTGTLDSDGAPDTGKFESVCVINEGNESKVYVVVNRTIDGSTVRYVEVSAARQFVDDEDYIFVDSALAYDGRNSEMFTLLQTAELTLGPITGTCTAPSSSTVLTDTGATWIADEWKDRTVKNNTDAGTPSAVVTTNDGTTMDADIGTDSWDSGDAYEIVATWAASEKVKITSDTAGTFRSDHVGTQFRLTGADGSDVDVRITSIGDSQTAYGWLVQAAPASLQGVATATWGVALNSFSGLDHLEGEDVVALVDGAVHAPMTVSSGSVTFGASIYGMRVQIGLPYTCDIETLPLHAPQDSGTIRSAKKIITTAHLEVDEWRGLEIGHDLTNLREVEQRSVEDNYDTINPDHDLIKVRPDNTYSSVVNLAVRQSDPIPTTLLSIIIGAEVGGNQ